MILGETITLTETVTGASAFTVSSPSVTVRGRTGASVASGTPTVTPGTGSTTQTLAFTFTPDAPGEYEAVFTVTVGTETRVFTQRLTVLAAAFGRKYPEPADLQEFLEAHGLVLTTAQIAQLPRSVAHGISQFETRVGRKMLAGAEAMRPFDPPTNGNVLKLRADLAAAPSSVVYAPTGSPALTLVLGADYLLEPTSGPDRELPVPYTRIRFHSFRRWLAPLPLPHRQSIHVTGQWGYSLDLPANAQEAMLALSALRMAPQLDFSNFQGVRSWKRGDVERSFGADPIGSLKGEWREIVDGAIDLYQRWEC